MGFSPPPGFDDMQGDADDHPSPEEGPFQSLHIKGVGTVQARKPLPNAVPALAMAANADIPGLRRTAHHERFVRNHLAPGEADRLLVGMMRGELPSDTYSLVSTSIATWGTARPT
jgi:hypothetical protein